MCTVDLIRFFCFRILDPAVDLTKSQQVTKTQLPMLLIVVIRIVPTQKIYQAYFKSVYLTQIFLAFLVILTFLESLEIFNLSIDTLY